MIVILRCILFFVPIFMMLYLVFETRKTTKENLELKKVNKRLEAEVKEKESILRFLREENQKLHGKNCISKEPEVA